MAFKRFLNQDDVETQVHSWGRLAWLNEPKTTGTNNMATGLITVAVGGGHAAHAHPGCEEILYFLKGEAEQTIYENDTVLKQTVKPGDLVYVPAGLDHSTMNSSPTEELVFLAVYQYAGPEADLRAVADAIEPPKNG